MTEHCEAEVVCIDAVMQPHDSLKQQDGCITQEHHRKRMGLACTPVWKDTPYPNCAQQARHNGIKPH